MVGLNLKPWTGTSQPEPTTIKKLIRLKWWFVVGFANHLLTLLRFSHPPSDENHSICIKDLEQWPQRRLELDPFSFQCFRTFSQPAWVHTERYSWLMYSSGALSNLANKVSMVGSTRSIFDSRPFVNLVASKKFFKKIPDKPWCVPINGSRSGELERGRLRQGSMTAACE